MHMAAVGCRMALVGTGWTISQPLGYISQPTTVPHTTHWGTSPNLPQSHVRHTGVHLPTHHSPTYHTLGYISQPTTVPRTTHWGTSPNLPQSHVPHTGVHLPTYHSPTYHTLGYISQPTTAPHTHQRQSQFIAHDRLKRGKTELVGVLVEAVAEHRGREGGTKKAVEPWVG